MNNTPSPKDITDRLREAINYSIYLLSKREYSQRELQHKLTYKGHDEITITSCLEHLSSNNYQSDERFTEMFVRARVSQKHGAKKIAYELSQRGIDNTTAQNALAEFNDDFLTNAQQLIIRKAPRGDIAAITDWNVKSKITRFLVGRGYDYDTIHCAFETVLCED